MTTKRKRKPAAKPKNLGGRPPHEVTPERQRTVEALAGYGIPQDKIAKVLDITQPTLDKHYRKQLDIGSAVVEAKLVGNLMNLCMLKDGTGLKATMFSLQTRFGWSIYAPAPADPEQKQLGKKEQADLDAQTAHEHTEWSDLVH